MQISRALLITFSLGSYPFGHAILTSTPNKAPHKIRELATLFPSPTKVKTTFLKSLNSSLIVRKSAKAWHGCSKSVKALITGFVDHFAYSSRSV